MLKLCLLEITFQKAFFLPLQINCKVKIQTLLISQTGIAGKYWALRIMNVHIKTKVADVCKSIHVQLP